jgi:hypothetical protein
MTTVNERVRISKETWLLILSQNRTLGLPDDDTVAITYRLMKNGTHGTVTEKSRWGHGDEAIVRFDDGTIFTVKDYFLESVGEEVMENGR